MSSLFPPSRWAAMTQLSDFLPNAGGRYARDRNTDTPTSDRSNVSMLSPYLRHRVISEEEVLLAVLERFAATTSEKFIQEVLWRGYFKGWLEHRPFVWRHYQNDLLAQLDEVRSDFKLGDRLEAAVTGNTGIAVFDHWSRELVEHGYLHNHARMWFASIWIFTLKLPWQLGADWFLQHLLDGDPASNTCSWRWVAGLHTKGKTYCARPDNIHRYAPRLFANDESPGLDRLAASAPAIIENTDLLSIPRLKPIWPKTAQDIDRTNCALLLHDDDLGSGETTGYAAVAALSPSELSPQGESDRVSQFRLAVTTDALAHIQQENGGEPRILETDQVGAWLSDAGLNQLIIPYAPVGPTAERVNALAKALSEQDVNIQIETRRYDTEVWPHAKAGFFKLSQKIPSLLDARSTSSQSR